MLFGSYSNQAEEHDHQVLCKLVELKFKLLQKKRDKQNQLFTQTALLIMQFVSNCFLLFKIVRKQAFSRVVSYF